jgi:hypothetical protein
MGALYKKRGYFLYGISQFLRKLTMLERIPHRFWETFQTRTRLLNTEDDERRAIDFHDGNRSEKGRFSPWWLNSPRGFRPLVALAGALVSRAPGRLWKVRLPVRELLEHTPQLFVAALE